MIFQNQFRIFQLLGCAIFSAPVFVSSASGQNGGNGQNSSSFLTLNHQGRIAVGGVNFTGLGHFKFAILNSSNLVVWTHDGTGLDGTEPIQSVPQQVTKGLYAIRLGDMNLENMGFLNGQIFSEYGLKLRVWFDDGARGFQQLTPDQSLAAVPYTFHAQQALAADAFTGVLSGDVVGSQSSTSIADATVTGKRLTGLVSGAGILS
ncbi:MAG: hypothetical protein RLZZ245_3542, partial [Verrucomicrobiota bacterium]